MIEFDRQFISNNTQILAGIDEAGRGPLAGPVCAACVIMPTNAQPIAGVADSKKLSPAKRELLYSQIIQQAIDYSVCFEDEKTIDQINILQATKKAMHQCLCNLKISPDLVLVDAVNLDSAPFKTKSFVKGDDKSYAIACASILAKVSRDRLMNEYDKIYPQYGFAKHKGYGTAAHVAALVANGPCPLHRKSFIKNFV